MNLATSLAVGAERFLSYKIKKKVKVLYVNTELNSRDFERRLQSVWGSLADKGELINFIVRTVGTDMDFWETVYKDCEQYKPDIIIIDCFYSANDKNENNGIHMKEELSKYKSLMEKFNLAIILIHHPIKGARYEQMHNDQLIGSSILSRRRTQLYK
jgi:RecA-family ATPase